MTPVVRASSYSTPLAVPPSSPSMVPPGDLQKAGQTLAQKGDWRGALSKYNQGLQNIQSQGLVGPQAKQVQANLLIGAAGAYRELGDLEKALESSREALSLLPGWASNQFRAEALNELGLVLTNIAQSLPQEELERRTTMYQEAKKVLREAYLLQQRRVKAGEKDAQQHLDTTSNNLARVLAGLGKYGEARSLYQETLFRMDKSPSAARMAIFNNLASLSSDEGKHDQALREQEKAFREAMRLYSSHPAPDNQTMGELLKGIGRYSALGKQSLGLMLMNLGVYAQQAGKLPDAKKYLEGAVSLLRSGYGADHEDTRYAQEVLAALKQAHPELFVQREK